MKLSGIDEVKNLHHHKDVEDKSKMTRTDFGGIMDHFVIIRATDSVISATSNSPTNHAIQPLILRMPEKHS